MLKIVGSFVAGTVPATALARNVVGGQMFNESINASMQNSRHHRACRYIIGER
jgi:hypothetical protein